MELILIRHALPVRRELVEGPADPELSDAGLAQAQYLAKYLASEHLDAIYTSPMRRAVQTAEPLAAATSLPLILVDDIAELDRNASEYVPVEELRATNDPRWQQMVNNEWGTSDETQDQFDTRVHVAIDSIVERHAGQRVVVVCHGGVINSYLTEVLGLGQSRGFFYPNYTSIHRVMISRRGQRQVATLNETAHLRGTGLPIGMNSPL